MLLLLPLCAAADDITELSTPEALLAMAENPAGRFVLTADIDMRGTDWAPFAFSGELDGGGHTLYNLTVTKTGTEKRTTLDGNRKEYDTVFAGLFSVAENARIHDISLTGVYIAVETGENCFLGGIAGYAADCELTGCSVSGRMQLTVDGGINAGLGGVAGYMDTCTLANAVTDTELVFLDLNRETVCEEFIGGLYASGRGKVTGCSVRLRAFASVHGYVHNGGCIGMAFWTRRGDTYKQTLYNTVSDTEITFFEDAPSRRGYADPYIGENLGSNCRESGNKKTHFVSTPATDYDTLLLPDSCAAPQYTAAVTEPTCTGWGWTDYTCALCGYTYRADYTPPRHSMQTTVIKEATCTEDGEAESICALCGEKSTEVLPAAGHTPGEWTTVREAAVGTEGLRQLCCACCGTVLEEEALPALPEPTPVPVPTAPPEPLRLLIDGEACETLQAKKYTYITLTAENALGTPVFTSSDPSVVFIRSDGTAALLKEGTAELTLTDGSRTVTVTVEVTGGFFLEMGHLIGIDG